MDTILAVAARHKLPVRRRRLPGRTWPSGEAKKLSTLGDLGCFSFQASKNLNSGEGGAILTNNDRLVDSNARAFRTTAAASDGGLQLRAQRRQPPHDRVLRPRLLSTQLTRLEEQSRRREQNAAYLTELLREVPGHHAGAHVRRLHAECLSSLHVPL